MARECAGVAERDRTGGGALSWGADHSAGFTGGSARRGSGAGDGWRRGAIYRAGGHHGEGSGETTDHSRVERVKREPHGRGKETGNEPPHFAPEVARLSFGGPLAILGSME